MTMLINQTEAEEALTSGNPLHRTLARGAMSEWLPKMMDWFTAELERPKPDLVILMQASLHLYLSALASLAAQKMRPGGENPLVELVVSDVERILPQAIKQTREALLGERKEGMQ